MDQSLSAEGILAQLGGLAERIQLESLACCQSTNLLLKQRQAQLPEWTVLAVGQQTGGRGRLGRSFYSPAGTGLYMSVLLRPRLAAADAGLITSAAAVAVCRAAEELGSDPAGIKWVNDVLVRGKKVCGILTEAGFAPGSDQMRYAVLGIGVNVTEPEGGFPPELASIAGAVFPRGEPGLREQLAAAILRQFYGIYARLPDRQTVEEYQRRCTVVGQQIDVLRDGSVRRALALAVDGQCRLLVRYEDGTEQALFSGEVSIRPAGRS